MADKGCLGQTLQDDIVDRVDSTELPLLSLPASGSFRPSRVIRDRPLSGESIDPGRNASLAALINAQVPGSRTALSRHQLLGFGARAHACLRWSATSGTAQAVKPIPAGRLAASAVWWE